MKWRFFTRKNHDNPADSHPKTDFQPVDKECDMFLRGLFHWPCQNPEHMHPPAGSPGVTFRVLCVLKKPIKHTDYGKKSNTYESVKTNFKAS